RIEADWQPVGIVSVAALARILYGERTLKVGGVVRRLRERIAGEKLVLTVEPALERQHQSAIPRFTDRRISQNRRRRAGPAVDVFRPAAGAELGHQRVVVDG